MPIRLNFKRTHRYNVSAKDLHVIKIYTLDGTCVEYTVNSTTTGKDALEYVSQRLDIENICVFGLKYEDWSGDTRWLFLNKPVKKQLDKYARQHVLTLTVMLFINNPQFISDPQLRRFFYLQLRQDVATGLLPVTLKLGIKLSAYSLQADFGDFVNVDTTLANWRERSATCEGKLCGAFDLSTTEYIDDILWGYLHLQGVSQDNAIWYFLDEIRHIPRYGVRTFRGMTCHNEPAELGVSRNGIIITMLEPEHRTTTNLKWEHIKDLTYSRKTFTIQTLKKSKSVHFLFDNNENARYLWQFCIQMHSSYIEYWTHLKASPQQPAIHISEPPDILRGTESRYHSDSPMLQGVFATGSSSSLVPSFVGAGRSSQPRTQISDSGNGGSPKPAAQASTLLSVRNSPHADEFCLTTEQVHDSTTSQVPTARDPDLVLFNAEPQTPHDITSETNHIENQSNMALLTAIHEATAESESGTLVGQWSLRSAADTLDSQRVNQGCVTCLSGRDWLRPTGWFQPRAGVTNTSTNNKVIKAATDPAIRIKMGDTKELIEKRKRAHHGQQRRRHQDLLRQQHKSVSENDKNKNDVGKKSGEKTGTPEDERSQLKMELRRGGRVLIDAIPPSPSSLISSDSSSEHGMVSSNASFTSSSSSCSETRKEAQMRQCDTEDESCSSDSSSTSSIRSNLDARCANERSKKTPFGFNAAALCSTAYGVSSRPTTKLLGTQTTSATQSGRKLWPPDASLRPLLTGFGQHHYRPQIELKRQQACANNTNSEQQLTDSAISRSASATNASSRSPSSKSPSRNRKYYGGKTFQEFQRWLLEAKQKFPSVWTNTVASRGMTLQISAPITSRAETKRLGLKPYVTTPSMLEKSALLKENENSGTFDTQHLVVSLLSGHRGRLARSSSETCAHRLVESAEICSQPKSSMGLQNATPNSMGYTLGRISNNSGNLSRGNVFGVTPTIHFYPASPSQSPCVQHSPASFTSEPASQDDTLSGTSVAVIPKVQQVTEGRLSTEYPTPLRIAQHDKPGSQQNLETNKVPAQTLLHRQKALRTPSAWRFAPVSTTANSENTPDLMCAHNKPGEACESVTRSAFILSRNHHTSQQKNQPSQDYTGTVARIQTECSLPASQLDNSLHALGRSEGYAEVLSPANGTQQSAALQLPTDSTQPSASIAASISTLRSGCVVSFDRPRTVGKASTINLSHFLTNSTSLTTSEEPASTFPKGQISADNGHVAALVRTRDTAQDDVVPHLNPALTNSSSSEQSSSLRQSSNGPLHLLTNSDIHQLLNLTNIRETELAHRLLAEYRLALLQQQSLHANSVSTPNLTASQELQMHSSSTAADEIEEVDSPANMESQGKQKKKYKNSCRRQTDIHKATSKEAHSSRKVSPVNHSSRRHHHGQICQSSRKKSSTRLSSVKRMHSERDSMDEPGPHTIDSPDYVNAAAFRTSSVGCGERPLSLASSTDMESNGTFRVLSSTETRGSSGAGWSTGNLTGPGASFGSTDVTCNSMDLTQSFGTSHNGNTEATLSNRSLDQLPQCRKPGLIHAGNGRRRGVVPMPELNESTTRSSSFAGIPSEPDLGTTHNQQDVSKGSSENVIQDDLSEKSKVNHTSTNRTYYEAYENVKYLPELIKQHEIKIHETVVHEDSSPTGGTTLLPYSASVNSVPGLITPASCSTNTLTSNAAPLPPTVLSNSHSSLASSSTMSSTASGTPSSMCNSEYSSDLTTSTGSVNHEADSDGCASMGARSRSPALQVVDKHESITICDKMDNSRRNIHNPNGYSGVSSLLDSAKRTTLEEGCKNITRMKVTPCPRIKSQYCHCGHCSHGKMSIGSAKSNSLRENNRKHNASQHSSGRCNETRSRTEVGWEDTSGDRRSKSRQFIFPSKSHKAYPSVKPVRDTKPVMFTRWTKGNFKKSPISSTRERYIFYSDDEDTEVVCCYSDLDMHEKEGSTSATLSPAESSCLSSASSYSYSLSSLDIKTEEPCPWYPRHRRHRRSNSKIRHPNIRPHHHHHLLIQRINTGMACCKDRNKRGGSLDPSCTSVVKSRSNLPHKKRSSQPFTNCRIVLHKKALDQSGHASSVPHRHTCRWDESDSSVNRRYPHELLEESFNIPSNFRYSGEVTTKPKKGAKSRPQNIISSVTTPGVHRKRQHRHQNLPHQVGEIANQEMSHHYCHTYPHEQSHSGSKTSRSETSVDTGKPPVSKRNSTESQNPADSPLLTIEEKNSISRREITVKTARSKDVTVFSNQISPVQPTSDANARSPSHCDGGQTRMSAQTHPGVTASGLLQSLSSPTSENQHQQRINLASRYSPHPIHQSSTDQSSRNCIRPSSLSYRIGSSTSDQRTTTADRTQFQLVPRHSNLGTPSNDSRDHLKGESTSQLKEFSPAHHTNAASPANPRYTMLELYGSVNRTSMSPSEHFQAETPRHSPTRFPSAIHRSITMSPTSPTLLYTTSVVVKPSTPNATRISPVVHDDNHFHPINVTSSSTARKGSGGVATTIIRSGSLDPSDLLLRQEVSGPAKATSTSITPPLTTSGQQTAGYRKQWHFDAKTMGTARQAALKSQGLTTSNSSTLLPGARFEPTRLTSPQVMSSKLRFANSPSCAQ